MDGRGGDALRRCRLAVAALASMALSLGCAGWPGAPTNTASAGTSASGTREAVGNLDESVSSTELRFRLQRFADSLSEALAQPLDELLANEPDIRKRKLILEAKYAYTSNAFLIASDAYPSVSLLDMIVFVNLLSASIEWEGLRTFGPASERILRVARTYEREVWGLAHDVLSSEQQAELRGLIATWLAANRDRGYSEAVRFGEFASELDAEDSGKARGLLSQIRHATATADHALELAERLSYFFQRAPAVWRMQAQLGYFEIMSQLEVQALLADTSRVAAASDRLSSTVSQLSTLLSSAPTPQQEELFANLQAGEQSVLQLIVETRDTLSSANELAGAADRIAMRFNIGEAGARPFDIAEYEAVALRFAGIATEFRSMIEALNELLATPLIAEQLPALAVRAESDGNGFLRNTVWLIAGSVVASFCTMLVALLAYRILVARLTSETT